MKMNDDMKRNCINIYDDIYILEKEYATKQRTPMQFMGDTDEDDRYNYQNHYTAIFKSVNTKNLIIYRYCFLNDIFDIDIETIKKCIECVAEDGNSDMFYQPDCTMIIEQYEQIQPIRANVIWHKKQNIDAFDAIINELLDSVDDEYYPIELW